MCEGRTSPDTFVVGQQIEESLSNFLPCEWLDVLQAVQQRADGIVLSLSVYRSHSVTVRKLAFSEEVQDVPLDGKAIDKLIKSLITKSQQSLVMFELFQYAECSSTGRNT